MCFRSNRLPTTLVAISCGLLCVAAVPARSDDDQASRRISLNDGAIQLAAPAKWEKREPTNRIVEFEFAAKAAEGDANEARITIMAAGGSIEANIARWMGQFSQPDGAATKDRSKVEQIKVAGQQVHLVDIAGTYRDQAGGPLSREPAVMRSGYRMLAAIISTEKGRYYVKMYGPAKTMAENEAPFRSLVESLKVN
jgi:hypothetical protein